MYSQVIAQKCCHRIVQLLILLKQKWYVNFEIYLLCTSAEILLLKSKEKAFYNTVGGGINVSAQTMTNMTKLMAKYSWQNIYGSCVCFTHNYTHNLIFVTCNFHSSQTWPVVWKMLLALWLFLWCHFDIIGCQDVIF